jgi:purine-binding chemotaxis protein CheW
MSEISHLPVSRYLTFSLGSEEYAIPLLNVREVIGMPKLREIPQTPSHFLGLMDLRGEVISVIDLRVKFNIKNPKTQNAEATVIIFDYNAMHVGVAVDSVNSVLVPRVNDISDKPGIESQKNTEYITGVYRRDGDLILLLDLAKTLSQEDHKTINKVKAAA